jgi:excisionase family DNA binding protein
MIKQTDELLTVQEVAHILRCDATTVRRWIAQGTMEAVTLPHNGKRRAYRIKRSVLDRLLHPDRSQVSPL